MNILYVNTYNAGGGAESIAVALHSGIQEQGHKSMLAVGTRRCAGDNVFEIPNDRYRSFVARALIGVTKPLCRLEGKRLGATSIRNGLVWSGQPGRLMAVRRGEEDYDFPATRRLLELLPTGPDLVHCHNLHVSYFDLRYLVELSRRLPVIITLHDEWMMTGHCACTLGCNKWKTGCGECPDLKIYPPVMRDATAYNWVRKRDIYSRSRLFVATPSEWLMDRVERSMLTPAIAGSRVIPNGVDLKVFRPGDRFEARKKLAIPQDAKVMLFTANGIRNNRFKDFETLREAIRRVSARLPNIDLQFLALGETAEPEKIGNAAITFVPYSNDPGIVAAYYQAADVYSHAANSDNFPTTVLESLACGTPVVATAIGGIPEQIEAGVTGHLVPAKDAESMAERICELLTDDMKREKMGRAAAAAAREHFGSATMVGRYLGWYEEILDRIGTGNQTCEAI